MSYSSSEIKNRRFAKKLGGYDQAEVARFLSEIADEISELTLARNKLAEKVIELETRLKDYQTIEKALQQTLMQGQETAGKTVEMARQEAQLILRDADMKAVQMLDKARADLTSTKEQATILKAKKDSLVTRLRMLLGSELELIKALELDEAAPKADPGGEAKTPPPLKNEIEEIIKQLG